MLRFIVRCVDYSGPAHGADMPAATTHRTFDVDAAALEAFLREAGGPGNYEAREVTGVEILPLTDAMKEG